MSFDTREFEFADMKVTILGKRLVGLRGFTYKKSQEKELVYAEGNQPKAIQRGNKKYEGTLMLLKSDVDDINTIARAAGYDDYVDIPGSEIIIACTYEKEEGGKLVTVSLINVEFTEFEDGMKQGDKFKEVSLPFIFLRKKEA